MLLSNHLNRSELNGYFLYFFPFLSLKFFLKHSSCLGNHIKIIKYAVFKVHMVNKNMERHTQHSLLFSN